MTDCQHQGCVVLGCACPCHRACATPVARKHRPRRDDPVATWIKESRDRFKRYRYLGGHLGGSWTALDDLLDEYRLHADLGVALGDDLD